MANKRKLIVKQTDHAEAPYTVVEQHNMTSYSTGQKLTKDEVDGEIIRSTTVVVK